MLLQKIICYLRGYLIIRADSPFPERFINICVRRGILLWDIRKSGEMRMRAKISIQGFRLLREIARRSRTRVEIVGKRGLPFLLHRYRKRRLAAAGLLLFCALMWYFSTHLMGITVTGNERVSAQAVTDCAEQAGVRPGIRLNRLDTDLLENQIMTALSDLAWVGATQEGSRLYIEVRERLEPPAGIDRDTPCNIIAERDGVISALEVREGQTLVKIDDAVSAGDLLVSGVVDSTTQGMRYAHAFGDVYAVTWYKKEGEYPLQYEEKTETGNRKKRFRLQLLDLKLNLYFNGKPPYAEYTKESVRREFDPPGDLLPSLFWECETYSEQRSANRSRTEQEALDAGTRELRAQLDAELPPDAEVQNVSVTHTLTRDAVRVAVEYECRENIAAQSPLDTIPDQTDF